MCIFQAMISFVGTEALAVLTGEHTTVFVFTCGLDLLIEQLKNLCIEIRKPSSRLFIVATCYRPPNSTVDKLDLFETVTQLMLKIWNTIFWEI